MSLRALHSAATGMEAGTFSLDTIANNLANAGTNGFKRTTVNFEDLYYEHLRPAGVQDSKSGSLTPVGISVGLGTQIASTVVDHTQGNLKQTNSPTDLAITGEGFFPVTDGNETFYTRDGAFTRNTDGNLVLAKSSQGYLLQPTITFPQDTTEISISADGVIAIKQAGSQLSTELGQIQLVRFVNQEGLLQIGDNLYAETSSSGSPLQGVAATEGRGKIEQSFLEGSNVQPVQELVELIKTQRNFELNSQVVQAADQALQVVSNLRRF
jgi:flagellar basal-body rod protein FlgG